MMGELNIDKFLFDDDSGNLWFGIYLVVCAIAALPFFSKFNGTGSGSIRAIKTYWTALFKLILEALLPNKWSDIYGFQITGL